MLFYKLTELKFKAIQRLLNHITNVLFKKYILLPPHQFVVFPSYPLVEVSTHLPQVSSRSHTHRGRYEAADRFDINQHRKQFITRAYLRRFNYPSESLTGAITIISAMMARQSRQLEILINESRNNWRGTIEHRLTAEWQTNATSMLDSLIRF